jgi:hypothetical protein
MICYLLEAWVLLSSLQSTLLFIEMLSISFSSVSAIKNIVRNYLLSFSSFFRNIAFTGAFIAPAIYSCILSF